MTAFYCPVCGKFIAGNPRHRCNESTLKKIEKAYQREEIRESEETKGFYDKIEDGFNMFKGVEG